MDPALLKCHHGAASAFTPDVGGKKVDEKLQPPCAVKCVGGTVYLTAQRGCGGGDNETARIPLSHATIL